MNDLYLLLLIIDGASQNSLERDPRSDQGNLRIPLVDTYLPWPCREKSYAD
jgi:hypothetical protein